MFKPRLLTLLCLSMALVAAGCAENPATGETMVKWMSVEQEVALGKEAAPEFEKEFGGPVENQTVQEYIDRVGGKLAAVAPRAEIPYEYTLLSSDTPNAFALPGGKIYVTAGLMQLMENERQLAAVLGHETAHVAAVHNVQQIQQQMGWQVLASLAQEAVGGKAGAAAKIGAQITGTMVTLKYSRKHEHQADEYGIRYMAQAGYNPYGMVELLTKLNSLREQEPSKIGSLFQTHPYPEQRIEETRKLIAKEYPNADPSAPAPNAGTYQQMRQQMLQTLGWR
jgi:predicted Zn-dependent protease